jgi:2-keto-3-deoxy-L-rhamnonate aldolase RhmA
MTAPLLERVRAGQRTLVLGVRGSRTADVVRIARSTGHHAILIDLEHSTMPLDVAGSLSAAAGDLGLTALVRVPEREYGAIGRLLDAGAHGIIAPRIETAAEAETVARACRFPPRGQRSQLTSVPQLGMRPTPATELNAMLNASTVVQVIVETRAGIANADAIAAVDGVDIVAMGANDLTAELGTPGDYHHPSLREAVAEVARACLAHDKLLMLGGIADPALFASFVPLGVCPLVLTGMDTDLLFSAAAARVAALTEGMTA